MAWTSQEQSLHSVTLCKLDLTLYSVLMLFLDCAWIVSVLFLICLLSVFSSVYRREWHCIPYCADVSLRNYSLSHASACVKVNAGQREHISSTNNMHQNSVFESCLDKKFFFFPGIKRTHWEEVYSCMLMCLWSTEMLECRTFSCRYYFIYSGNVIYCYNSYTSSCLVCGFM